VRRVAQAGQARAQLGFRERAGGEQAGGIVACGVVHGAMLDARARAVNRGVRAG
jgi:hypothetical protein